MARDQKTIRDDLTAALVAYQAKAQEAESVWRPLADRVKALQTELHQAIATGAVPCSRCGAAPIGLRHPRFTRGKGNSATYRHVFEVGCRACADTPEDDRRGFAETPGRSSGADLDQYADATAAAAVAEWNAKNKA